MVKALTQKLRRDLWQLKGQVFTIGLVVACGVASYVTMRSTWSSLESTKAAYYDRFRFAHVFANLSRAPDSVTDRLGAIPGVSMVRTRITKPATIPLPGLPQPATALLISTTSDSPATINALFVRKGRRPMAQHGDEVVVIEGFADAHGIEIGDSLPAIINGTKRTLRVVGIALSPEYVFAIAPGDFTSDDARYAVLWMARSTLAAAFNMEGAFNDVSLRLAPGIPVAPVIAEVDRITEPYGGLGAVSRSKQMSNFILQGELDQLRSFAVVVPIIFLGVAAFLLNIVLARLVQLQRQQIAILKAVGYANSSVARHYLALVAAIVVTGAIIGLGLGGWLGSGLTRLYASYFRLPTLDYGISAGVAMTAIAISLGAALVGTLGGLRSITRLPAAVAMRPPAPASYRTGILERLRIPQLLGASSSMVLRELKRRPIRVLLSAVGIGCGIGIIVVGRFGYDSFESLVEGPMHRENQADITVSFYQPSGLQALSELRQIPGVLDVEGTREVPVRFRVGHRVRDASILALAYQPRLRHIVSRSGHLVELSDGLALSHKLAEVLGIGVGDSITVNVKQGRHQTLTLSVSKLIDDAFGLRGYVDMSFLHKILSEETSISTASLVVDPEQLESVEKQLQKLPDIAQITRSDALVERFREQSGKYMWVMTLVLSCFGGAIAVGIIYNNARVALSMRRRDLASLRVLGFSRREVSTILLGELGVQLVLAIPIGLIVGNMWAQAVMSSVDPETYRMPVVISPRTYVYAVLITLAAGIVSALLVRRKSDKLDLISVLKTRE